ncbi:MAG: nucleotide exchange factor GrpE [Alphaproteobacteria bacterium]|jgi:molecular chaperone GrpE|nr:nucleotide exchange factor GrpE [Alphaproteobacteria bacterium]
MSETPTQPEDRTPEEAETEAPAEDAAEEVSELDALRAKASALEDRLMRALAETENVRRRAEREREDATKYAITGFARDIVGIADDLGRAVGSAGESDPASVFEGIEMTLRSLDTALERYGITCIDPQDEKFDHNLHEAMFEVESPDKEPGTVVQVVQRGYRIHDRLLRPARVGVAKRPASGNIDTEA